MATSVHGFQDISAENSEVTEVESLCLACERNGTTRLLMVKIPFYKEIFVSSFSCPHCGYNNCSSMAGQEIQEEASEITLLVKTPRDMNRTVVMSDYAALKIPELDFEAPYRRQSFGVTTVEGVITKVKEMIEKFMEARGSTEEGIRELGQFVPKLDACLRMQSPFHLVIDDPSGNSFVENPHAPNPDPGLTIRTYARNQELDELVGIMPSTTDSSEGPREKTDPVDEVMVFPTTCYNCKAECVTNMKTVDVPHFKEILIMSSQCDKCGWRNNEAKPSGGIEEEGCIIDLLVAGTEDLDRHVIKVIQPFQLVPWDMESLLPVYSQFLVLLLRII
ncbi:hypothetical protein RvY_08879-2 [Ramazzottius varieornatus]|uniref:Zinc finger ZPR1-type domain-containing protein n=1 Tax=Ramazzottius varieornatus TaxID=947166 RepID=A0A1D1V9L4_RAMVA|nr:hypothetical protein RvY_08879-2 [Ramazzottius varieornatus]